APCPGGTCIRARSSRHCCAPRSRREGPRRLRRRPRRRTGGARYPSLAHDPARVGEHTERKQADVEIGGGDDDEARPRPPCVPRVQRVGPAPESIAERAAVEAVEITANEVA